MLLDRQDVLESGANGPTLKIAALSTVSCNLCYFIPILYHKVIVDRKVFVHPADSIE
jgi:hypothetical protein